MQLGNVTTEAAKDYGITFVRQQYVAGLADDHPDKTMTDWDYAWSRLGAMIAGAVDSWAQQADAAANTPPTGTPGGVTGGDWHPQATTDLNLMRAKLLGVLTSMQTDYTATSQADNAAACLQVKEAVKVIETSPAVLAAYLDPIGTRAAFDAAVKARWLEIVAPAPAQVKADFNKYGGNTI